MKGVLRFLGSLVLLAAVADAMQPLPCPETRFLMPTTYQGDPPQSGSLRLADFTSLRGLDRACTEPRIRVRRLSAGFLLRARWRDCPLYFEYRPVFYGLFPTPRPAPLRFSGFVPSDCSRLGAHFRARWYGDTPFVVRDFDAS